MPTSRNTDILDINNQANQPLDLVKAELYHFIVCIAVYVCSFLLLDRLLVGSPMELIMAICSILMIATIIYLLKKHIVDFYKFLLINLGYIVILGATTVIHDQIFGTVELISESENTIVYSSTKFYFYTLPFNQAMVLSNLVFFIYSLITRRWKFILTSIASIGLILAYFSLVV